MHSIANIGDKHMHSSPYWIKKYIPTVNPSRHNGANDAVRSCAGTLLSSQYAKLSKDEFGPQRRVEENNAEISYVYVNVCQCSSCMEQWRCQAAVSFPKSILLLDQCSAAGFSLFLTEVVSLNFMEVK